MTGHTNYGSSWQVTHGCEAATLDGSHIGKVARFSPPTLPGIVDQASGLAFDVQITGRIVQVGHAAGTTTVAVDLGSEGNAFMFALNPTEPIAFLDEAAQAGGGAAGSAAQPVSSGRLTDQDGYAITRSER